MNRREALKATSAIAGAAMLGSTLALEACSKDAKPTLASQETTTGMLLSAEDQKLIEDVADTILPTTPSSPGAKAAGVGAIINLLLTDCTESADQQRATRGINSFRQYVRDKTGRDFATLSPNEREKRLVELDAEAKKQGNEHYFHQMRELTQQAYFSSEIGMTKALRYIRVPGRWTGCVPLEPGQPAWG
jgi:hypothetical protein